MSKQNVDQKSILGLLSDEKSDFLIPEYQQPYIWNNNQCRKLWDGIFNFTLIDIDHSEFKNNNKYFLGPIVAFKNNSGKLEVVGGGQRLITIMIMLRAFYDRFCEMKYSDSLEGKKGIERCFWQPSPTEIGKVDKDMLKINLESTTDNNKREFLEIIKGGIIQPDSKSQYAINYKFFKKMIRELLDNFPSLFEYLSKTILENCTLQLIEAESQDATLRILSTISDHDSPP